MVGRTVGIERRGACPTYVKERRGWRGTKVDHHTKQAQQLVLSIPTATTSTAWGASAAVAVSAAVDVTAAAAGTAADAAAVASAAAGTAVDAVSAAAAGTSAAVDAAAAVGTAADAAGDVHPSCRSSGSFRVRPGHLSRHGEHHDCPDLRRKQQGRVPSHSSVPGRSTSSSARTR